MMRSALIVEDNPLNCALFTEILRHAGFASVCDTTGMEALHLAETLKPSVAVIDLKLPHITGHEVIRMLRATPGTSEIPIIAVSAFARTEDGLSATRAGADLYMPKPVDPWRLAAAVKKLVHEPQQSVA